MTLAAFALLGVITGRLVTEPGTPLKGVSVELRERESAALRAETRTAPDGRFRLEGLPAGEYRLSVHLRGWSPLSRLVRLRREGQELDLRDVPLHGDRHARRTVETIPSALPDQLDFIQAIPPAAFPLCDVLQHPTWFHRQFIRVRGLVRSGEELFELSGSACARAAVEEIWLEYGLRRTGETLPGRGEVTATLTGRLEALHPDACRRSGFGPFGQYCARLVIFSVSAIAALPAP